MESRDFDFHVGGIEDGIIDLLTEAVGGADGYARTIETYGGELDGETLRKFNDELTPRFPLFLVAYTDGSDKLEPAQSAAFGEPRTFQHDCSFAVFCCSDNARSEQARRRGANGSVGVYRMIADVRKTLAGRLFRKRDDEEGVRWNLGPLQAGEVLLNLEPMRLAGVQFIARLPDLTAYGVHFETFFQYVEPDRRAEGRRVERLLIDVQSRGETGEPGGKPGVRFEIGSEGEE